MQRSQGVLKFAQRRAAPCACQGSVTTGVPTIKLVYVRTQTPSPPLGLSFAECVYVDITPDVHDRNLSVYNSAHNIGAH